MIAHVLKYGAFFTVLFGALVIHAEFARAQNANPIPCVPGLPCVSQETQKKAGGVQEYVVKGFGVRALRTFMSIIAVASTIFIIVGGVQLHVAAGNDDGIKNAKLTLTWAIIGLVIALLSVFIVSIVGNLPFAPRTR